VSQQLAGTCDALAPAAARTRPPFLLVTGGKGGVGKTTLTANLGVQLAREGRRVLLCDLDLGLANLDVMLRIPPGRTLEDALAGRARFAECVARGPEGVDVLPAGSGTAEMGRPDAARRARIVAGLRGLAASYDLVIGDGAAGIGPDVLAFAALADHVFVVTTPLPAAMTDAYGLIKALDTWGRDNDAEVPTPEVVVNLATGLDEAERTATRLRTVCERFLCRSPRTAGWLPAAPAVAMSGRSQRPFATGPRDALENGCLRRLSARVARLLPSPHENGRRTPG